MHWPQRIIRILRNHEETLHAFIIPCVRKKVRIFAEPLRLGDIVVKRIQYDQTGIIFA